MISILDRAARLLFNILAFASFLVGGAFLSWFILPIARLGANSDADASRRCRRIVGRAFVLFHDYMRVCRLIRYDPRRVLKPALTGPFVIVANHPTLVDVTAILAAFPDAVCIVKGGLFRNPAIAPLLRACRHIVSERDEGFGGTSVLLRAVRLLKEGVPVLIFPEGTRSPEHGMHRWRRGAFEIAARAGCPVVPIRITCDPPVLARTAPWYRTPKNPSVMTLEVLTPVDPARWGGDTARMSAEVEGLVRDGLVAPRAALLLDHENPAISGHGSAPSGPSTASLIR